MDEIYNISNEVNSKPIHGQHIKSVMKSMVNRYRISINKINSEVNSETEYHGLLKLGNTLIHTVIYKAIRKRFMRCVVSKCTFYIQVVAPYRIRHLISNKSGLFQNKRGLIGTACHALSAALSYYRP